MAPTDGNTHGVRILGRQRKREFLKYAAYVESLQLSRGGDTVVSSKDTALTAYAQLVSLRLNAKRATISLFDNESQYIVAEATKTLSLQSDVVHDPEDALFWGATKLPRGHWFCEHTLGETDKRGSLVVIPDTTCDARSAKHPAVLGEPYIRSYVGMPLISTGGFAIGTLAIYDNQIRLHRLSTVETVFMKDAATTIMRHLEMAGLKQAHLRGLRMVKGLSHFIEGKDQLEPDETHGQSRPRGERYSDDKLICRPDQKMPQQIRPWLDAQNAKLRASSRTNAFGAASDLERISATYENSDWTDKPSLMGAQTGTPSDSQENADRLPVPGNNGSEDIEGRNGLETAIRHSPAHRTSTPDISREESNPSQDRQTFSRAANLIQTAMDVSGVLFLDTSVTQLSAFRPNIDSNSSSDTSDGNVTTGTGTGGVPATPQSHVSESAPNEPCAMVGSSQSVQHATDIGSKISRKAFTSLMRRFPYGKIWTFDEGVGLSSDELSESSGSTDAIGLVDNSALDKPQQSMQRRTEGDQKRRRRVSDDVMIQEWFPGVHSVAIMPLWDMSRGRVFGGCIVWNDKASRILTYQDDINYLVAFCDVTMAEKGRLDTQAEIQTKTRFIRSISHELRSPLHGILGSIEYMQEKGFDALQDGVPGMIDTCGRTLMDIIDHLIEHAQVQSGQSSSNVQAERLDHRSKKKLQKQRGGSTSPDEQCDLAALTEEICDIALWSTPKSTPHSNTSTVLGSANLPSTPPLKVMLDMDSRNLARNGWNYMIAPGAWRRLLLNLVTNSIKYTDEGGFLHVELSVRQQTSLGRMPSDFDVIELVCTDSGRGMSQEYLDYGLWKEFSQEDSHSQGVGLGLSLVHSIVKDSGGNIDVQSKKGRGTIITVLIPLRRSKTPGEKPEDSVGIRLWRQLEHPTYQLVGFDAATKGDARLAEATAILRRSVERAFSGVGLHQHDNPASKAADVYVVSETAAMSASESGLPAGLDNAAFKKPWIVLCHSAVSAQAIQAHSTPWLANAIFVSQPLGPRKLFKALESCFTHDRTGAESNHWSIENVPGILRGDSSTTGSTASKPDSQNTAHNPQVKPSHNNERQGFPETSASSVSITSHDPTKAINNDSATHSTQTQSNLLILLVDDNDVNLRLLQMYTKRAGHRYITASNGQEAFDAYSAACDKSLLDQREQDSKSSRSQIPRNHSSTVILMDITMYAISIVLHGCSGLTESRPVMDGLESTRRIRSYERSMQIKPAFIVALTALAGPEAKEESYASGVNLFMTKPVRFNDLASILINLESKRTD